VAGDPPGTAEDTAKPTGMPSDERPAIRGRAWAETEEEVRLAMGWNGGVSLAIWMGGVAVELDEARRTSPGASADPPPASTSALYSALAKAFNRRLVIDILTGASAGGLNGALLAGVIVHGKELRPEFLRERWLDIGDFGSLLKPIDEQKPTSVMQGQKFFNAVKKAFADLLESEAPPKPAVEDEPLPVLLDVQVTNVVGHQRQFVDDWGLTFYALEHRAPIQFRKWRQFDALSLATAARASASFPGAFESVKIADSNADALVVPHTTWAVDGGLLENAPIRQAIELIPQRPASGPVTRYVCYVNAAPTSPQEMHEIDQPDLRKVIGYAINLPRTGRVVDQLYALEEATRRAGLTATIGCELVNLETEDLLRTAEGLLPAYQRRRAALSLEELLSVRGAGGPGRAHRTLEVLAKDANAPDDLARGAAKLPWIPAGTEDVEGATSEDRPWRWGTRAAQRIIQLELDLLRDALLGLASPAAATTIFGARQDLDQAMARLETTRLEFLAPDGQPATQAQNLLKDDRAVREKALFELALAAKSSGDVARQQVESATAVFYRAFNAVAPEKAARLFAPLPDPEGTQQEREHGEEPLPEDGVPPDRLRAFVVRALAVELIRRSLSDDLDIESAQTLHVAQLTPLTESPLFDRGYPSGPRKPPQNAQPVPPKADKELGPALGSEKLAGVRLGHFAGFYRRSWRENDFMWGRLDGAAMIARLLIDTNRAQARAEAAEADDQKPWSILADALLATEGVATADEDRLALIEEHLGKQQDLRAALVSRIENDLTHGSGELTRSLVARALQYQILREELPALLDAVDKDRTAGASLSPVRKWSVSGSLDEIIAKLRTGRGDASLPALLGADDRDEATSQLALRTLSHTLLVATAALGGAVPLGRLLQPLRVPLLSIQGSTAKRPLDRIAAAIAFTGAAWFVNARLLALIQGDSDPSRISAGGKVPINALWTSSVLAYIVSALAVLGFAAVPLLRAIRSRRWRRILLQGPVGLSLLAGGGLVLFVEAVRRAGMSEALTTWSAPDFGTKTILYLVATAGAVQVASTSSLLVRGVALGQSFVRRWVAATSAIYAAIAIALAIYAAKHGLPHSWSPQTWRRVAFVCAIVTPLIALGYVRFWAGWNRKGD
jgi:patatin-related protein